jgi:hypothetical protein
MELALEVLLLRLLLRCPCLYEPFGQKEEVERYEGWEGLSVSSTQFLAGSMYGIEASVTKYQQKRYLERFSVCRNATSRFVVVQCVPKDEGNVGINICRLFITTLFQPCLDIVQTTWFRDNLEKMKH